MKIAIPLFGRNVAPRFGVADQFLIVIVKEGKIEQSKKMYVADDVCLIDRLSELEHRGVGVILCGGFNRKFEPLAETFGIQVIAGLVGNATVLAEAFARGENLSQCSCRKENLNCYVNANRRSRIRCRGSDTKTE